MTIIIGCTHAGTTAALTIKSDFPSHDVTIVEVNNNVSFLSCGIAIGIGRNISMDEMFYSNIDILKKNGIQCFIECICNRVDFNHKTINMMDLNTKNEFSLTYENLIIATGSSPQMLFFKPSDRIFLCKSYEHGVKLQKFVQNNKNQNKKIALIGGGYIGVELVESFLANGFHPIIVESQDSILKRYYNEEIITLVHELLIRKGCQIFLNSHVTKVIEERQLTLEFKEHDPIQVDAAVLCLGFKPCTDMVLQSASRCGVEIENIKGAIVVNENSQTNIEDVFAVGDAACVQMRVTNTNAYIPLATNAVRQALSASFYILKKYKEDTKLLPSIGALGTSIIKVFGVAMGSTGLSIEQAKLFVPSDVVQLTDEALPEFVGVGNQVTCVIIFEVDTLVVLGVQAFGYPQAVGEVVQIGSVLVQNKYTLQQVVQQDFAFNPSFDKPLHILQATALKHFSAAQFEKFK